MNFSEHISNIIEEKRLTVQDAAGKAGVNETTFQRILRGDGDMLDIAMYERIVDKLGYELSLTKKTRSGTKKGNVNRNGSGYFDPTAGKAIAKVDAERERLTKLLDVIFAVCEIAGFHVEERIVLLDKRTGKVWR